MTTLLLTLSLLLTACAPGVDHTSHPGSERTEQITDEVRSDATALIDMAIPKDVITDRPRTEDQPSLETEEAVAPAGFDHTLWEKLLLKHVNSAGMVNYAAIGKDPAFTTYLGRLSAASPSASWSDNERKAFWINAYNAFTIKLIVEHPGVKSIKDIDSPWKSKFFSIGGVKMDLDHVEHIELRDKLKDPRIHFGIVCASFSCPQLWDRAFTAADLDNQLDDAARRFINDPLRNKIGRDTVELSRIFEWFKGDFTDGQTLITFLNQYAKEPIATNANVQYLDYDWRLNAQ